ncbi:MAG: hypothetical protein WKF51_11200 [Geodermatophilaceae bacterium]
MNIHLGAADTDTPSRELPADLTAALYVPAFGRSLPVLLDVWPATGGLLGMSRFQTYEAVKRNDVPSIRVGGRIKVPTAMLLDRLGIPVETTPQSAAEPRAIAALA